MLKFSTVNLFFGCFLVTAIVARFFVNFSALIFIIPSTIWLVLTILGSGLIQWNYFLTSFYSNPNIAKQQVSITFDDGPHPEITPKVLDLLNLYNAKATFFCIGKHIIEYPELFKQIIAEGHTVGNHTHTHRQDFGFLSTDKVIAELNLATATIYRLTGKKVKMYRPAFGVTNPRIQRAVKETGLISIGWNKRSLDTMSFSVSYTLKRITKNLKPGDIILLHDTSEKSLTVLEHLLLFLEKKKIESIAVDSLLNIQPYA